MVEFGRLFKSGSERPLNMPGYIVEFNMNVVSRVSLDCILPHPELTMLEKNHLITK
jgi:hypothetical protein